MKRLFIAAVATLSFAAPLAIESAAADDRRDNREWRDDRRDDRRDYHHDRRDDRRDYHHDRRDDRRDYRHDRYDDRRTYNSGYHDGRRHSNYTHNNWDRRQYNGYYYRDRWNHGPPPVAYYSDPYYRPGYRAWRKGDHLPPYYRQSYVVVDYRHHRHLYAPPRGCHWVRSDRGEYLLVGVATGLILGLALGG
jgi:Ni/Co efflux regulator RcnB